MIYHNTYLPGIITSSDTKSWVPERVTNSVNLKPVLTSRDGIDLKIQNRIAACVMRSSDINLGLELNKNQML